MADYRRKRKNSGSKYDARRRANYRKRPYTPSLGGGGYSGPRNYFRTHDFRYEREPSSKPPKTETHYEVIERPSTESYRLPAYRPEPDQTMMEKAVGKAMEKYLQKDSENKPETYQTQGYAEPDASVNLQEVDIEAKHVETALDASDAKPVEISAEPAQPLLEIYQEPNAIIDKGADLSELPSADLELLLIELEANPLEVQPDRNIEAEPGTEQ